MDFGVYVHVPFCRVQCPYCTFYTVLKPASALPMESFLEAVWREWELRVLPRLRRGDRLRTLYLGGGTPSDLPREALLRFFARAGASVPGGLAALDESTVECNPESIDATFLERLHEVAVERVSLGVQALHEDDLRTLGRAARVEDVQRALGIVSGRCKSWNADLIVGVPGSSWERLRGGLEALKSLGVPHISFYCLEVPGVRAALVGEPMNEAADVFKADLYECASHWVEARGYEHYEISNAALPGHQAEHNQAYWNGREYVGLGPGAHSFEAGVRRANQAGLERYCRLLSLGHQPASGVESLTDEKRREERLLLGLRQRRGVEVALLGLESQKEFMGELVQKGLANLESGRLQLTTRGWLVSDSIVLQLVAA